MEKPVSQRDLVDGLKVLGLQRGTAVEVHSSLSSLGWVDGGATTVIQALMEVVGEEGAIVMPAHRVSLLLPLSEEERAQGIIAKIRFLDEDADCKTGMGIVADTFRHWPGTHLGKGIHRVCAWGRNAEQHSQGFDYLLSDDGWALLIGVDITRLSSMHTAEGKVEWPQAITEQFQIPEAIQQQYPPSDWYIEYHNPCKPPPGKPWLKVQAEAERRGLIRRGRIGQAKCMLFKAKPVVDIYEEYLRTDPFQFFDIAKE